MRIRKNKQNLAVEGTFLPEHSSFLVCQLNRSPWDDDFLFSQFIEEKWDHCLDLNASLPDSIPPSDRRRTPIEETIIENVERTIPSPLKPPTKFVEKDRKKEIEVVREAKTTSSQSYRGKRDSYHLARCVSPPPPSAKKVANLPPPIPLKPVSAPRKKRKRPIKKPASATGNNGVSSYSNNSFAFYYYSGFSPSWSKRRSGDRFSNTNSDNTSKITTSSVVTDAVEGKKAKEHWLHGVIGPKGMTHGSSSSIMSEDDDDDDNVNISSIDKMGSDNNDINKVVSGVETVVDERLDYIDDDDGEEEDDGGLHGAKRIQSRKPIKARSLKSIM